MSKFVGIDGVAAALSHIFEVFTFCLSSTSYILYSFFISPWM